MLAVRLGQCRWRPSHALKILARVNVLKARLVFDLDGMALQACQLQLCLRTLIAVQFHQAVEI